MGKQRVLGDVVKETRLKRAPSLSLFSRTVSEKIRNYQQRDAPKSHRANGDFGIRFTNALACSCVVTSFSNSNSAHFSGNE